MRSRRHLPVRPAPRSAFSGYRFPPEVITRAVRWYLRFGLSYRDIKELLAERGVEVDHVSVYRWSVQRFAPEFAEAARARQHIIGDRWHVDETYLKVDGSWRYLFRAIDQFGQVIDVYLSPRRDAMAECSAILIFTADEEFTNAKGETVWRPSENVVYELGAASFAYEDRIVIFMEDGLHFPANFESVGRIDFQEDAIEAKTMDLLKELVGFGLVKITPA